MVAYTSQISQMPQEQCSSTFRLKHGIRSCASEEIINIYIFNNMEKEL